MGHSSRVQAILERRIAFPSAAVWQSTLGIIKPDAYAAGHAETILAEIAEAGLKVKASWTGTRTEAETAQFYAEHVNRQTPGALWSVEAGAGSTTARW